jgi:hypothetical protein
MRVTSGPEASADSLTRGDIHTADASLLFSTTDGKSAQTTRSGDPSRLCQNDESRELHITVANAAPAGSALPIATTTATLHILQPTS